ncbi:MAG: lysophospholipase [Helicobacteraceae bacterium]|jgi:pimeloyl-ACP methyl ester carboxylesterase|nr:lysophospholipase [Helicobacteraceae bacterium]
MNTAIFAFSCFAACYILATLLLIALEEKLIFLSGFSRLTNPPTDETIAFKLDAQEGFRVKRGSKTLLLWFDGNADNVWYVPNAIAASQAKLPLLDAIDIAALNYRGYGASGGKPSQEAIFADALKLYDALSPSYDRVVALGRSLGSGVVCYLSSRRDLAGAILITPFDSVRAIAKSRFGFFLAHLFIRNPFDSVAYVKGVQTAFSILEVARDRVVPNKRTKRLKEAIANLALYERVGDTTHAKIATDRREFEFIERSLERFLNV